MDARLGNLAVAAVVFQGVLGGVRVLLDERLVAMIHGCVGPAFFALTTAMAVFTSRRWLTASQPRDDAGGLKLARVATITAGLAYAQLVLGALLRHSPATGQGRLFQIVLVFHLFLAVVLVAHARNIGAACLAIGQRAPFWLDGACRVAVDAVVRTNRAGRRRLDHQLRLAGLVQRLQVCPPARCCGPGRGPNHDHHGPRRDRLLDPRDIFVAYVAVLAFFRP